jgi:hypothetical protein
MNTNSDLVYSDLDLESEYKESEYNNELTIDKINQKEQKGILKKNKNKNKNNTFDNDYNDENIIMCVKTSIFLVIFTIAIPFIVCNLCYAYSDDSCVNLQAGNLDITLKTYLEVDGIFGAVGMLIVSLCICCFTEKFNDINESFLGKTFGTLITLFGLAWTITGAIIFWNILNKCDNGVYNYVFTQLIIKFVCYFFKMVQNIIILINGLMRII